MPADAEGAFAKEDGRAVFTMLDDQSLRSHGENLLRRSRQIGFTGQHLGLAVVDHENVDQAQSFAQLRIGAADPVVHGVAAGQLSAGQFAAHRGLQAGMNIGQE